LLALIFCPEVARRLFFRGIGFLAAEEPQVLPGALAALPPVGITTITAAMGIPPEAGAALALMETVKTLALPERLR
jgi:hypothetical protein